MVEQVGSDHNRRVKSLYKNREKNANNRDQCLSVVSNDGSHGNRESNK